MTPPYDDVRITVSDGVELAARIWLPAEQIGPAPAVLECHPYRACDATIFDSSRHRYAAEHGYVSVQLDLRGSGESGGVLLDEYLPREQADVVDVIAWIRCQSWCSGTVGLYGISWGGFLALQVAALDPPGLGAIIAVCATDDRYVDDAHYVGGCVIASDMLSWSTTMLAYNARPPDPKSFGDGWFEAWRDRLESDSPWVSTWLRHQRRDDYWRHGSVGDDLDAIRCPMLLVGGWADGYRNSIPRMLRSETTRAVVGPWSHSYPNVATPGPQIGFLDEMLRWWNHWLRGHDRGIGDDPPLRAYLQDAVHPGDAPYTREGEWVGLDHFPARRVELTLAPDAACPGDGLSLVPAVPSPTFFSVGSDPRWYLDQRLEDEQSLSFTSDEISEPIDVLGVPDVEVELAGTSHGAIVVRLCDVWPDGASTLLARGIANLNDVRRPVADRDAGGFKLDLSATSVVVPAGHRLRVAISSSAWPLIWPPAVRELRVESVALRLPVIDADDIVARPTFGEAALGELPAVTWTEWRDRQWAVEPGHDGIHRIEQPRGYPAAFRIDSTGLTYDDDGSDVFEIAEGDPSSATVSAERMIRMTRGEWSMTIEARSTMRCDTSRFYVDSTLRATLGGQEVFCRSWSDVIPREGR